MGKRRLALILALLCLLAAALAGCLAPTPTEEPPTQTVESSASPTDTATPSATPTRTATPTPTYDVLRPWGRYAAPNQTPVTQVPPPANPLARPEEVRALLLMGTDRQAPYVGRTDAIQLLLYHPRLARASLISLPPDLLVYIPGTTMQRLQIAYALGGPYGMADTIQYNFGIRPNHYVLVHIDEFVNFIDRNLAGLDVPVLQPYANPKYCGGILPGTYHMTGSQVLCYIRFRVDADEAERNHRQQEVFRLILLRMVQSGSLARLPELVRAFGQVVETDLKLSDLVEAIPLVLRLGDPKRVNYYSFNTNELEIWKLPENLVASSVFLPKRAVMEPVLQDALNFIQTPAPLSEVVRTYEAALTNIPTATATRQLSATPTLTRTGQAATVTGVRTATRTATRTLTPTPNRTSTGSPDQSR